MQAYPAASLQRRLKSDPFAAVSQIHGEVVGTA